MAEPQKRRTRNAAEKQARIIAAAQVLFTEKGYSQTSVRDIAERAEVAAGLVIRHFESKLRLFEIALTETFTTTPMTSTPRDQFGRSLASVLLTKEGQVAFPVMIMLSLEDEDARQVAMKVVREPRVPARKLTWCTPSRRSPEPNVCSGWATLCSRPSTLSV